MPTIQSVSALEVLDSRGYPTVCVEARLSDGSFGQSIVPSGASTGSREALERRDGDMRRYLGKGVMQVVNIIDKDLSPKLIGRDGMDQGALDDFLIHLDGTENKSRFGANAILGISMACAVARSRSLSQPLYETLLPNNHLYELPVPMMNILNGGAHADNNIDLQEFMIIPFGAPNFTEAVRWGSEIYHTLKKVLRSLKHSTGVGDEGGFAPNLPNNEAALECICESITLAGFKLGKEVGLALDCAASEFYHDGAYDFEGNRRSSQEMVEYYQGLVRRYPILSIEDGLAESDWQGWQALTRTLGSSLQLVGDDIFVTNPLILQRGISEHIANALLVKLNQIGTVSETISAIKIAQTAGYQCIISHRSGESEDTFIADLAVGCCVNQIKTGAPARTDRVAKYNRLLRIDHELSSRGHYAGLSAFRFGVK